jgi:mono/diheme cytochrome c family protein
MKFMGMFQHRVPLIAACLPMTFAVAACNQPAPPAAAPAQTAVERGKMLVIGGACHDCHTPKKLGPKGPEPDMDRMLSGHPEGIKIAAPFKPAAGSPWTIATTDDLTAWSGPWGVSFPANLTPDTLTGLRSGVWTEELFIKALSTDRLTSRHSN